MTTCEPAEDEPQEAPPKSVPRAPGTTIKPYPPEADPLPQEDSNPVMVPGEQVDPRGRPGDRSDA